MTIFDNIKVGDKVIYSPALGHDVVATVTKVTKAGNFATDKTGTTLWNQHGYARGSSTWDTARVLEYSEEYLKTITESRIIAKAINMMRKCDKSDLTVEQAEAIINILNSNE